MMNKKLGETLIISEELLKLYSPLSKNVDVDKIYPYLHLAQPYFIEPILGTALLQELQEQVDSGEITVENKALILKVAPVLAYYGTYLAMRSLAYSITEKGITLEQSENSRSISEKELGEYILAIKNQAEMYADILIKYLCRCALTYPLWRPQDDCHCERWVDTEGKAEKEVKFTVFFPNKKNEGCDGCNRDIWIKKQ